MKRNILIVALFMLVAAINFSVSAQNGNMEDVVYLKNGSIIHGTIIEQIPNESLKLKTKDGSVFVYKIVEVEKITKEQIANSSGNNGNYYYSGNQYANIAVPSYKQLKMNYNPHMYIPQLGDPYNPTISGVCSWLVPGLGQIISGETGRGFGFLGGYAGCYLFMGIGGAMVYDDPTTGGLMVLAGAVGMITVDVWSIVDAVHVAKVKNMYVNDMRNKTSSLKLELSPYVDQISMNNQIVRPVGMTMRIKF
jgi:hypothetical protein